MILDGKETALALEKQLKTKLVQWKEEGYTPKLAILLVGDSKPSHMYAKFMMKVGESYGIPVLLREEPTTLSEEEVKGILGEWNEDDTITGILPMMPLPAHLDEEKVISFIHPDKDIDGLTVTNSGRLFTGKDGLFGCTPRAVMAILDHYNIEIDGKHAVVMGRSAVIGKPVAEMLLDRNATVTVCHSHTRNIKEITQKADIIVVAVGRPNSLTADMIKPGTVVIDVGINRLDGKTVGDVEFENVKSLAGAITPVPGGVGSVTTTMVIESLVKAGERMKNR